MPWYAASQLYGYFSRADGSLLLVEESVVLIEAPDGEEADAQAAILGHRREGEDPVFNVGDVPAEERYLGARRIVTVQGGAGSSADEPGHGAEVMFSRYELESHDDLEALVRGASVRVVLEDE
jgi:hypothetical protein